MSFLQFRIAIITLLVLLFFSMTHVFAQTEKEAYKIYTKEGKEVTYQQMVGEVSKSEIILFGEIHNNPIAHWLKYELTKDLHNSTQDLTLGLEMLEADNQLILDEYLQGHIEENHFLNEAKMWNNYKTDYRPLVEFAKENQLPVIASNIPRRYANLVYRNGLHALDSLADEAKKWIVPLPVLVDQQLPQYQKMVASMQGHGNHNSGEKFIQAQAIKDATMAYMILKNKKGKFIHFNGAYHSQHEEGIIWYLRKSAPELQIATIETVEQENIESLLEENLNKADFLICIPESMTKTF
ncbi:ChaN family lipoprotein [soil metagenome]